MLLISQNTLTWQIAMDILIDILNKKNKDYSININEESDIHIPLIEKNRFLALKWTSEGCVFDIESSDEIVEELGYAFYEDIFENSSMRVHADNELEDDNDGFVFGVYGGSYCITEENFEDIVDVSWFKTEEEREEYLSDIKAPQIDIILG